MACIGKKNIVFHPLKMASDYDVAAARSGHKDVAKRRRIVHLHYSEAVHCCLESAEGIDLGNYDIRPKPFGAHGYAARTEAVACDNDSPSGNHVIGGIHDAVPYALAGAVAVIEQMLAVRIVNGQHGEWQGPVARPCAELMNACGSFLAAADEIGRIFRMRFGEHGYEFSAIIDDDMGLKLQNSSDVFIILLFGCAKKGMNIHSFFGKRCADIVLGRKWVASGY